MQVMLYQEQNCAKVLFMLK